MSPHPSGLTSRGSMLNGSLAQILGCLIILLRNASQGSIFDADDILYLIHHSSILNIFCIVYCTLFGIWNHAVSFTNCSSTTISSSFCCIVICFNWLYILWVTVRFMFVTILPLFFGNFLCHKLNSLQQLFALI